MLTMAIPDVEICMVIYCSQYGLNLLPDGTNMYGSKGGEYEGSVGA